MMPLADEASRSRYLVRDVGYIDITRISAQPIETIRAALDGWRPARELRGTPTGWLQKDVVTSSGSPTSMILLMSAFDGRSFVFANATAAGSFAVDHPPSVDWDAMGVVMQKHGIVGDMAPLESEADCATRIVCAHPACFPVAAHALDLPMAEDATPSRHLSSRNGLR